MPVRGRVSRWRRLLRQLTHLLALLLWAAAFLAFVSGTPELGTAIIVIVLLNAAFAFAQEDRADRSAQRLQSLMPAQALVRRDGRIIEVSAASLVPGDCVMLSPGGRVAADMVVDASDDLMVDESLLTGESVAVRRSPGGRLVGGSFVVQGEAQATVLATGAGTRLAAIAALSDTATRPPSPLSRELDRVVRVVAIVAGVVAVVLGATAMLLGLPVAGALIFAIGVAVALVPEGLLPTVTLSLARGAELMAGQRALVRRLDAVETLGATTFICTDKTGTLTQNQMNVVDVVTFVGDIVVAGAGYGPVADLGGSAVALGRLPIIARTALRCVSGRVVEEGSVWRAQGDPMEAALHCLALRAGCEDEPGQRRFAYSADRMLSSAFDGRDVSVLGAPESVLRRCIDIPADAKSSVARLADAGRRVLAVASRTWAGDPTAEMETGLTLLGLIGMSDPPRPGVRDALDRCHAAGIRIAMITGDHPLTGAAIAREVGLLGPDGIVLDGPLLPATDVLLAELIDHAGGVVVARATPDDKLRIARALRSRGHVIAMTGDGVNDAPALREADVGVAMGASGSDVAREAADVVLLDDHFATIVAAIELGRATFANVRRFLTFHLTDNVAELTPFVVWAVSGGAIPPAIGVLQVIALDIGSDILPALALGAEPPRSHTSRGSAQISIVDRALLVRAFVVLGGTEALFAMGAYLVVLLEGGWQWGQSPAAQLQSGASGAAFAAIVLGQIANAFACRSTTRPVWRMPVRDNLSIVWAVTAQFVLLLLFLGVPPLAQLLGGGWPPLHGWAVAVLAIPAVILTDAAHKTLLRRRRP